MPIAVAFTFTALLAAIFNVWFLGRSIQRRIDLRGSGLDGELRIIANSFIRVWTTLLLADILVFAAGVGILTGHRLFGYLLAVMPIASTFVGIFALRGLLRKYKAKEVEENAS